MLGDNQDSVQLSECEDIGTFIAWWGSPVTQGEGEIPGTRQIFAAPQTLFSNSKEEGNYTRFTAKTKTKTKTQVPALTKKSLLKCPASEFQSIKCRK